MMRNWTNDPRFKRTHGGMVQCLSEATGQVLWRLAIPERPRSRLPVGAHYGEQRMGTCSSPAVSGNRAYVMTGAAEVLCLDVNGMADGNDGPFQDEAQYMAGVGHPPIKLGKQDGDIIWSFDLVDQLGICPHDVAACSPLLDGRFLYTTSCNGVDRSHTHCLRPDAPSFIALDTETGKLLATDTEDLGHRMWHCLWSPPSIGMVNGKKLVFFGGADGICYAFEALTSVPDQPIHFKKVWQFDNDPPNFRMPDGKPDFNYYIGDKRKGYTTNKDDGKFLGPSEMIAAPVFHDGRVYTTIGQDPSHGRGRGLLHCIDATKTGDITTSGNIWTYEGIERTASAAWRSTTACSSRSIWPAMCIAWTWRRASPIGFTTPTPKPGARHWWRMGKSISATRRASSFSPKKRSRSCCRRFHWERTATPRRSWRTGRCLWLRRLRCGRSRKVRPC